MPIHRRGVLAAAGLAALSLGAEAQETARPAQPPFEERLARAVSENRHRLDYDGRAFSGPAYDLLVREGRAAQFFLIGEEHGIAENPKLAAQLFKALAPAGYRRFGIEISPPMAQELDRAAASAGFDGLARVLNAPASRVAFFGMAEEARMLADVRAALPREREVFWGFDYEVAADRRLIDLLERARKPRAAQAPLAALRRASDAGWARYDRTRNFLEVFSFSGDPALVRAVRAGWPNPDARSAWVLDTLEQTLEINQAYAQGRGWESNRRRAAFLRASFLRHWRAEAGRNPKVMLKLGSNHLVRGRNDTETFDLGALLPEVAALSGGHTFSVMMLPGVGATTAVLEPQQWRYAASPPKDSYSYGLDPIVKGALPDAFTLIDMRPLRSLFTASRAKALGPEVMRVVHGYDAVIVFSGSTASSNL